MTYLGVIISRLAVRVYALVVYAAASFGQRKARLRIALLQQANLQVTSIPPKTGRRAWIHAASAGEWLQLSSLAGIMKEDNWDVVVSFFSPSALPFVRNGSYPYFILPFDSSTSSRDVAEGVSADIFITCRRELWPYLLEDLKKRNTPVVLLNVYITENLSWVRQAWWATFSPYLSLACCIDGRSADLLLSWRASKVVITGDTRFDNPGTPTIEHKLSDHLTGKKIVILGSGHKREMSWMAYFIHQHASSYPDWYWVIVPHELREDGYATWEKAMNKAVDKFDGQLTVRGSNIIYIDTVGVLAGLYSFSSIAVVGGGWDSGTHNIIEAAGKGNAIIMGPRHESFPEAAALIGKGAAVEVKSYAELQQALRHWMENEDDRKTCGEKARTFVSSATGASARCYSEIKMLL